MNLDLIFLCLTERHDFRLVGLAALVCVLASLVALTLAQRSLRSAQAHSDGWLAAAGVVAGAGIWATHFIAVLAFHAGAPIQFDATLTIVSVVIAAAGAVLAFAVALAGPRKRAVAGGLVLGLDIAAMHYAGMAAIRIPTLVGWDFGLVALSLVLGMAFAAAGFRCALLSPAPVVRTGLGTGFVVLAICTLHFAGMGALRLAPWAPKELGQAGGSVWWLSGMVAAAISVVLLAAFAGIGADRYLADRMVRERRRLRALCDATFEGIVIHAGGVILDVNRSLVTLSERRRADLVGGSLTTLFGDCQCAAFVGLEGQSAECRLKRADGSAVPVEVLARAVEDYAPGAQVVAVRDLTEKLASRERIHELSFHDPVTGLPNRAQFLERLRNELAIVGEGRHLAVLRLSIERLESINHAFGAAVVDSLLRAIARRIAGVVVPPSMIARLQDDEFAIIQPNAASRAALATLCRRLVDVLGQPFELEGETIVTGTQIGIKMVQPDSSDPSEVLKRAGFALAEAKADATSRWRFYENAMDAHLRERLQLECDLRLAAANGAFELYYQPLVDIASGRLVGCEALVRWFHATRGTVPPSEFVPIAEEIGVIGAIGRWVLAQACAAAVGWPAHIRIAVNLSAAHVKEPDLVSQVDAVLAATGLAASRLEVEVTESILLEDENGVLERLNELRQRGVRIAMDDFGTGFSSFSYLRRYPFDKLKLDQSLVRGVGASAESSAIVRAVVALGHSLGMTVTAEGVETAAEWHTLRRERCDEGQGFLFGRPMAAAALAALIDAGVVEGAGLAGGSGIGRAPQMFGFVSSGAGMAGDGAVAGAGCGRAAARRAAL